MELGPGSLSVEHQTVPASVQNVVSASRILYYKNIVHLRKRKNPQQAWGNSSLGLINDVYQ